MKKLIINKNDAGQRLDKFIKKAIPTLPDALMYKYIRKKRIKVNGKKSQISTKLNENDFVECYINDEFFVPRTEKNSFLSAPSVINLIYEDENLIILDKKPGLVVHEDENNSPDTLINRLLHYLYDKKEYIPSDEQSFRPALVNRIDRNTGGIVIAAKNASALRILNEKLKQREISKYYLCLAMGHFKEKEAVLSAYLKKDSDRKTVSVKDEESDGYKEIKTGYKVIKEYKDFSLLEVTLYTGRTHQIRAHLAHMGHPLLGDGKYGKNADNKKYKVTYQALYSYKISFDFSTDADILNYLKGKTFEVDEVWFTDYFKE